MSADVINAEIWMPNCSEEERYQWVQERWKRRKEMLKAQGGKRFVVPFPGWRHPERLADLVWEAAGELHAYGEQRLSRHLAQVRADRLAELKAVGVPRKAAVADVDAMLSAVLAGVRELEAEW